MLVSISCGNIYACLCSFGDYLGERCGNRKPPLSPSVRGRSRVEQPAFGRALILYHSLNIVDVDYFFLSRYLLSGVIVIDVNVMSILWYMRGRRREIRLSCLGTMYLGRTELIDGRLPV